MDYKIDISLELNIKPFLKQLNRLEQQAIKGAMQAMEVSGQKILDKSLEEVPRHVGTLASSAFKEVRRTSTGAQVTVGYGREGVVNPITGQTAASYMLAVHEDLDAYHSNGKAKYLEDPVRSFEQEFLNSVASSIRTELRG